jgi:hypothetical protein
MGLTSEYVNNRIKWLKSIQKKRHKPTKTILVNLVL